MHIKTAWNDYFTGNPSSTLSNQYGTTQNPSATSVYVLNCLFKSITSGNTGGALYCTSVTYLLIESTSFFSCKTSNTHGGAIYFHKSNSQCVLHKVCGYDCFSTYAGSSFCQFALIYVSNSDSSKNYLNYSSVTRCTNENSGADYTLGIWYGLFCLPSVNISMNKCSSRSGIYCCVNADPNSVTCSLTYSTFSDNIATSQNCIMFYVGGANYEIKSCNIIRNTQVNLGSQGTIYTNGNLMIDYSCILENKATYIFYDYSSSNTITLSKCTVDKTSSNVNLVIQNTVTKSFILALNHMSTRNCHSEYDSAGTLSPIMQLTSSSNQQKHYCSYRKCFYQPHLGDFVSIMWVFVFNFIHPYASSDPLYQIY